MRTNPGPAAPKQKEESSNQTSFLNTADMLSAYSNASLEFSSNAYSASPQDVSEGAKKLAWELEEFVGKGLKESGGERPSEEAIADLQLQTARKLRQLLPTNREMLHLIQEKNWIPTLLSWLNLHDRPAVQMEALLALTNIAEQCAQQSYYQHQNNGDKDKRSAPTAPSTSFSFGAPSNTVPAPTPSTSAFSFPPTTFSHVLSPDTLAALGSFAANEKDGDRLSLPTSEGWPDKSRTFPPSFTNPSPGPPVSLQQQQQQQQQFPPAPNTASAPAWTPPPMPFPSTTGGSSIPQPLSTSSQHLLLRHADAIPTLISLLTSPNREVHEQAMWILGSIAAGESAGTRHGNTASQPDSENKPSVAARDVVLAAGVMRPLLRCLEAYPHNLSLQRIGSWALSNLVEGQFQQKSSSSGGRNSNASSSDDYVLDDIKMHLLLPTLRRLLNTADAEVLTYTCWTLSHLCDGPSSHISAVVTSPDKKSPPGGLVPRLVELLLHPSWRVTKPALRTIGNIVCAECSDDSNSSSTTDYTEVILDCNAVPRLKQLITHNNREIQKEACWTLSNIAAGTVDQIQAVIDSGAIPPLVKLVGDKSTDQEVRSEACWVVLNATSCGSDPQIEVLVDEGCVSVLGVLLGESSMVMMALEGLERVLQVEESREVQRKEKLGQQDGNTNNNNASNRDRPPTLVSASLIEKALEKHSNSAVSKRASKIWKQHFVSCALCHQSFSRHRTSDASFCEECKCHVCTNCDCKIYHLSYQEELWAESEKSEVNKKPKKKKPKKKKNKKSQQTENAATPAESSKATEEDDSGASGGVTQPQKTNPPVNVIAMNGEKQENEKVTTSKTTASDKQKQQKGQQKQQQQKQQQKQKQKNQQQDVAKKKKEELPPSSTPAQTDDEEDDDDELDPAEDVDLVNYLQETGSIIALAKLMDALGEKEEEAGLISTASAQD